MTSNYLENDVTPNITMEAMEEEDRVSKPKRVEGFIFDEKNYLNIKLDASKNEKSKDVKIRILPIDGSSSTPFKTVYVHNVKVPKEVDKSGFKNLICIEKTEGIDHEKYGKKCPFCEMNRNAYKLFASETDPAKREVYKKMSLENLAREACIIRCIERGHEDDGPKFWKFNVRADKIDPKNTIKKLYRTRLDESREVGQNLNILDIYTGKDLKITIERVEKKENSGDSSNKKNNKTSITIIDSGVSRPLSDDPEQVKQWVFDSKKWSDVFGIKPYEYSKILMDGGLPWFNKVTGKWYNKWDEDNEEPTKKSNEPVTYIHEPDPYDQISCNDITDDDILPN